MKYREYIRFLKCLDVSNCSITYFLLLSKERKSGDIFNSILKKKYYKCKHRFIGLWITGEKLLYILL